MTIKIRISPTIQGEYEQRSVFGGDAEWPLVEWDATGVAALPADTVKAMLADADHNCNPRCVDIGPDAMPLGTANAYRALARQCRKALATTGR